MARVDQRPDRLTDSRSAAPGPDSVTDEYHPTKRDRICDTRTMADSGKASPLGSAQSIVDGIGGNLATSALSAGASTVLRRIRTSRAIRGALEAAGLHPGSYNYHVSRWLKHGGTEQLADGTWLEPLRAALQQKADDFEISEECAQTIGQHLFSFVDADHQGDWQSTLDQTRHHELLASFESQTAQLLGPLSEYAHVIRGSDDVRRWVDGRWSDLNSPLSDNKRPNYATREFDAELEALLLEACCAYDGDQRWDKAVVLSGVSKCGKTRSLLEAIKRLSTHVEVVVVHPKKKNYTDALRVVNRVGIEPNNHVPETVYVILLDDLQDLPDPLEESSQLRRDPTDVHPSFLEWTHTPDDQLVIIAATTWPSITNRADTAPSVKEIGELFKSHALNTPEQWSEDDYLRLDADLREALEAQAAETDTDSRKAAGALAAAPILGEQLRLLRRTAEDEPTAPEREARRFVMAASLGAALQNSDPSQSELREIFESLCTAEDSRTHFDSAFRWATKSVVDSDTGWSLVREAADSGTYRLADFLWEDALDRLQADLFAPQSDFLSTRTTPSLLRIGVRLYGLDRLLTAKDAFSEAANRGDAHAMFSLGVLEQEQGNIDDAHTWYTQAANNGHTTAAQLLEQLTTEKDSE